MTRRSRERWLLALVVALGGLAPTSTASADAAVMIVNRDGAGEGFNDPEPAAPVGGNPGTTVGEQRLIAFQHATDIWGQLLDSEVPIVVDATFDPLSCDGAGAVLGQANTQSLRSNFDGAPRTDVWYPAALANRLARSDLDPGDPDIVAQFNSTLGDGDCLAGSGWYYGLDAQEPSDAIDLVAVVLHELAHGLGASAFVDLETGDLPGDDNYPSMPTFFTFDRELGKYWSEMSDAERAASATGVRQLLWDGEHTVAAMPDYLQAGMPGFWTASDITGLSGAVGLAEFGPALQSPPVSGELVRADDGVDVGADGCEALAGLDGKVALIDRGQCFFTQKVANAQAAGAVAVLIADNVPGGPPAPLGFGADPPPIVIPSVRISLEDGVLLDAALGNGAVTASLGIDDTRLAGEAPGGGLLLFATDPVSVGSSVSHWDPVATPNLLMEPAIEPDLDHGVDVTLGQLRDLGWLPFECGNGLLEPGEQCDAGLDNDDAAADACRTDCREATCGDGVVDSGEDCDDGDDNSDAEPDACRSDCQAARCGDGVVDTGEQCDSGPNCSDCMTVPEPEPDAGTDAGAQTAPDAGTATDSGTDTEPDSGSDSGTATDSGTDTEPDSGPGSEPATGSGTDTEPDSGSGSGADTGSETDAGCGCSTPGGAARSRTTPWSLALALAAWLAFRGRRRRRGHSGSPVC
ncbi:MAG: MYXO-CTERM sorting domain-containing protein [Myxococcales bacterium]